MNILGLETSCDETSAAIIVDGRLRCNIVRTQEIHRRFGGVVPEVASREHQLQIADIVAAALDQGQVHRRDLDAIAVTYGAGLMGALLVGLNFAKGMAIGLNIPFLGVNHLEGHLYANFIDNPEFDYPYLCLLVSGGHTQIWQVLGFGEYQLLGQTRDDAAGEAFDKGARILGLGYPGGPAIEKTALAGNPESYKFTVPVVKSAEHDFSFSGIKTALYYRCRDMDPAVLQSAINDLCASYQEVIITTLIQHMQKAVKTTGLHRFAVAGGVAANTYFRYRAMQMGQDSGCQIYFPQMEYCTDNAAMIAMAGYERLRNGEQSSLDLLANPNLRLDH